MSDISSNHRFVNVDFLIGIEGCINGIFSSLGGSVIRIGNLLVLLGLDLLRLFKNITLDQVFSKKSFYLNFSLI